MYIFAIAQSSPAVSFIFNLDGLGEVLRGHVTEDRKDKWMATRSKGRFLIMAELNQTKMTI